MVDGGKSSPGLCCFRPCPFVVSQRVNNYFHRLNTSFQTICLQVIKWTVVDFSNLSALISNRNLQQDSIQKLPVVMHNNLQRESHKPYGPPVSVLWLQLLPSQRTKTGTCTAPTNLRAHDFAHAQDLWHARLADIICAWSARLCGMTSALLERRELKSWFQTLLRFPIYLGWREYRKENFD